MKISQKTENLMDQVMGGTALLKDLHDAVNRAQSVYNTASQVNADATARFLKNNPITLLDLRTAWLDVDRTYEQVKMARENLRKFETDRQALKEQLFTSLLEDMGIPDESVYFSKFPKG